MNPFSEFVFRIVDFMIAVTAHAMEEDRNRCMAAGMDEYLAKPVKAEALREAMERWTRAAPADA